MIHLDGAEYATRAQAAECFPDVTPGMVRNWEERGILTRTATLGGRPVYRMLDVYRAERQTRLNATKPRRQRAAS